MEGPTVAAEALIRLGSVISIKGGRNLLSNITTLRHKATKRTLPWDPVAREQNLEPNVVGP
jgi:hypothetical protein